MSAPLGLKTERRQGPEPWVGCLDAAPRGVLVRDGRVCLAAHQLPAHPFIGPLVQALSRMKGRTFTLDSVTLSARRLFDPPRSNCTLADAARDAGPYGCAHDLRRAAAGLGRPLTLPQRVPVAQTGGVPTVILPLRLGEQLDVAVGRGLTYAQAERGATFEALERHCAPHHDQPLVRSSYAHLDHATDPAQFLLPCAADLAHLGSPWQAYHPELSIDWTPAYSCVEDRDVLVPARLAFFGHAADPRYVSETTSGSALGSSVAEARLHALMELIERDAFLMTWYARRRVPRVILPTDAQTRALLAVADAQGYRIEVFVTTLHSDLPSVWVLARRVRGEGAASLSSAGAHLDPLKALHSALWEVTASISLLGQHFDPVRASELSSAPQQVRTSTDHFLLFGDPTHVRHLDFLHAAPERPWLAAFSQAARWRGRGPAEHLQALVKQLLRFHRDIYFVDQTRSEVRRLGLHCARALVPGSLPMTFGHFQRRVHGARRLAALLGHRCPAVALSEHFTPHPFG